LLKEIFIALVSNYTDDYSYRNQLWDEIAKAYNKSNRYYHNLTHLDHLYNHLVTVKTYSTDWDMILFSIFYHDYIYNALKKDNEEQSALKAKQVLQSLEIDLQRIELCTEIIITTKGHQVSKINDINYFTDADLSILGSDWQNYKIYLQNVRKEYRYYPDFMYNKGRIKVLKHFIAMPQIFKTDYFYTKFENQAKKNLVQEIQLLSS